MNFSKPLRNLGNSYACVGFSLERDEDRHGASESVINVGMDYLVSETHVLSPLTPALSPLRGEGELSAIGRPCSAIQSGAWSQCIRKNEGRS